MKLQIKSVSQVGRFRIAKLPVVHIADNQRYNHLQILWYSIVREHHI